MHSHVSSTLFATLRRPIPSVRNNHVHSETSNNEQDIPNLDLFQQKVSLQFHNLSEVGDDDLLSISWVRKLLDAFVSCQDDFQGVLRENKALLSNPHADKIVTEYFEWSIKAMNILNMARDGIETIHTWQKHLDIIVTALDNQRRLLGEGQIYRARKAVMDLTLVMQHEKDTGSMFSHNSRSFVRKVKDHRRKSSSSSGHSRSLSWSASHLRSSSNQLQLIASSLIPPRANNDLSGNGLGMLVFTMGFILMFVLWVLVAAIPCQDQSMQIHFTVPRNFIWSIPLVLLQSKIVEESKKSDRRNLSGLLREIYHIEKCVNQITRLIDATQFPLVEELKDDLNEHVQELSSVCDICKAELEPLECQLRQTFMKVMSCRTEGIELLGQASET